MPYTMTHLIIADKLSEKFKDHIKNTPQFYLGNIAPDAVHNRSNYTSDHKRASHLCVGEEKWGMITNNDEWKNNVINFLDYHKNSDNRDFIIGYGCHIVADIYQNIALWTPFRQRYATDRGITDLMMRETNMIDIELALTHEKRDVFWLNIQKSVGVDIEGIIYAAEIEKQKNNILNIWYADKTRQEITSNKIVTMDIIMDFIKNAVDFVVITLGEQFG